ATPIVLSDRGDAQFPHHEVMVNLSPATPALFARFERLIELVGLDEADRAAGRERFRHYRQRGYPIEHRNAGQK
ncbi:MAG TPA: DNA polymerase III subunit chi, partial [Noviherbaspirillum sp.]|nr:DNA polymerase III subunit chi [Noviherbaspirillum sp.]